jgi:WXG100 family type VII secretion target
MNVKIDTAEVEKISAEMNKLIQEYQRKYNEVYTNATEMGAIWDGEAKKTYMQRIEGFRNDFEKMVKVLSNYSSKLGIIAKRYKEAEENAKNLASKLSVGK